MSGDSYFRHKVVMEIGTKKRTDKEPEEEFKDDRELLDYLLEQERRDLSAQSQPKNAKDSD